MHRIGIISSPWSKQNKRKPGLIIDLEKLVSDRGTMVVTYTLHDLEDALSKFKQYGVEFIAINGGDGTVSHVMTKAVEIYDGAQLPSFVPLRGGNFNILADNLGIKTDPRSTLEKLLELLKSGGMIYTKKLRTLQIANQIGFLFANGSASRFLEEFYKNKGGAIDSALHLSRLALAQFFDPELYDKITHNSHTEIWVDGGLKYAHECASVFCSTLPCMAFGINIFPRAEVAKGFECVVYHNPPRSTMTKGIIDSFVRPHKSPYRSTFCGRSLRMEIDEVSSYSLDGELLPKKSELEFGLGPEIPFVLL
jgi:diacylglycerol kinase (ATP)